MKKLTIIARILAKKENREFIKAETLKLVDPTRSEEGCISYDLYEDNENENLFIFIENWESEALLQKHTKSTHFVEFSKATEGTFEEFTVEKLSSLK